MCSCRVDEVYADVITEQASGSAIQDKEGLLGDWIESRYIQTKLRECNNLDSHFHLNQLDRH